jgi:uncharacterized membrane protein YhhN
MPTPTLLTLACLAAVAALLVADRLGSVPSRVVAKLAASTGFVCVAVSLGAMESGYGRWVLAALVLGWLGDALLLGRAPWAFLGGLGAFLLSHALFAAAFAQGALALGAMGIASAVAILFGAAVLRWVLPHTPADFKLPVVAYLIVILGMNIAAAGHAVAQAHWAVLLGAVSFTASDLAVARDRFVCEAYVNRLWGWPAYFVAQLVLAWSVVGAV